VTATPGRPATSGRPPTVDDLDVIAPGAFAAAVAPLFEGAPRFLGRLAMARPFGTADELFAAAHRIAHAMPEDEQIELVNAHPRLGAAPGTVSKLSFREQGYDRDTGPTVDVATELTRLNEEYEALFGFRHCVFVAGRSREALLPDMRASLTADRDSELHRALDAVIDVARDRYAKLSAEEGA